MEDRENRENRVGEEGVGVLRDRLQLEGFGCRKAMAELEKVHEFLEGLALVADMRVLVPPIVVKVPVVQASSFIETTTDWGVSGYVFWLESGASVHTWPEYGFVAVDIFSCKRFDHGEVERFFRKIFQPKRVSKMESTVFGEGRGEK